MAQRIVAVVLASGGVDALARAAGVATKALVPFGQRSLLGWVLDALAASHRVDRVFVVEPESTDFDRPTPEHARVSAIRGGTRLADSLALGLGAAATTAPHRVLVITADLPWVTGPIVDGYIERAPQAELVYPVVRRERMEDRFPMQRRTYARLADGRFTGGNAVLLSPSIVPRLLPFVDRAYRGRKNPLALARLVGWDVAARMLAGRLTIADAEARVRHLLGGDARVMQDADPALAADIDRPDHLALRPPERTGAVGDPA